MLMSRHIGDHATSTEEAIEIMANATRGVPWIYPLCDGNGAVLFFCLQGGLLAAAQFDGCVLYCWYDCCVSVGACGLLSMVHACALSP